MRTAATAAVVACLASLLATSRACAAISPQAKPVVDRWIEASGGRAAFLADTMLHVKGRSVAGGERGTFEFWRHGPAQYMEAETEGTLRVRHGLDGATGWRTDVTSKKVAPLEGKDLEAIQGEAWFASEMWARDDQGGGKVWHGQHAFKGGRGMIALDVTPPVGPAKTLWFDDDTGLLVRVTHHRDQYTWDESYGGWRVFAGRKRWTVATVGDSVLYASGYRRANVDSIRAELPTAASGFAAPASTVRPVTWLRARGAVELPFRYRRGHVWVRASINGTAPADFILDTGCTMSALDREYVRRIGLPLEGRLVAEGVAGADEGGWAPVRSLRLATPAGDGVEIRDLKAGVLELNDDMRVMEWDDAAGLIGYDVLSRFVVDLDFDRQVVTLHDPATFRYSGRGQAVPFTLHACIPTVEVRLNAGCVGRFIVDVGNATVMTVHTEQVDACHLFGGRRKEIQHWIGGIGGAIPETVCRLDSVLVGPFGWSQPIVGLTLHHLGTMGSKDVQGNIGTSVLERFRCTFDYAHSLLWLEPGQRFAQPDRYSHSGLYLHRFSGRVWITAVVRHSPADDAGLKVRDVLKAVDGRPIDRWTPEALDAVFRDGPIGSTVRLTIERDLVDQDIELTLADVL